MGEKALSFHLAPDGRTEVSCFEYGYGIDARERALALSAAAVNSARFYCSLAHQNQTSPPRLPVK
eukprot:scaffold215201_cov36-Tisochrysis_lutea.AAC.1